MHLHCNLNNVMIMTNYYSILLLFLSFYPILIYTKTKSEAAKDLYLGNTKILSGCIIGDTNLIRRGISEYGDLKTSILTQSIGESILRLGPIFPTGPCIHVSIYQGNKEHLEVTYYLLRHSINVNQYQLPYYNNETSTINYGYPPAILYGLGLFKQPTPSHAASLQKLLLSIQASFVNTSKIIDDWRLQIPGNPPLLHIPILSFFFDGVYALATSTILNDGNKLIHQVDDNGLTPLHLACYYGDVNLIMFLLSYNATPIVSDKYGRTPLHYLSMRGHHNAVKFLLHRQSVDEVEYLNNVKDVINMTAISLALLKPAMKHTLFALNYTSDNNDGGHDGDDDTAAISTTSTQNQDKRHLHYQEDLKHSNLRGGWYYPQCSAAATMLTTPTATSCATTTSSTVNNKIDIRSSFHISKGIFKRYYFYSQRPLVITDNLILGQPIWAYWYIDDFINRYGNIMITYGEKVHSKERNPWTLPIPTVKSIKEYVYDEIMNARSNCIHKDTIDDDYLLNQTAAFHDGWIGISINKIDFKGDIRMPSLFDICKPYEQRNENMTLYIGTVGSGIPIASHNASYNVLLTGKTKWYLIAPGNELYARGIEKAIGDYHIASSRQWIKEIYPNLHKEGMVSEVIQYPGDIVYVPHGWLYTTINLAESISVSQEICSTVHTNHYKQSLGYSIYGGYNNITGLRLTQLSTDSILSHYATEELRKTSGPYFGEL